MAIAVRYDLDCSRAFGHLVEQSIQSIECVFSKSRSQLAYGVLVNLGSLSVKSISFGYEFRARVLADLVIENLEFSIKFSHFVKSIHHHVPSNFFLTFCQVSSIPRFRWRLSSLFDRPLRAGFFRANVSYLICIDRSLHYKFSLLRRKLSVRRCCLFSASRILRFGNRIVALTARHSVCRKKLKHARGGHYPELRFELRIH